MCVCVCFVNRLLHMRNTNESHQYVARIVLVSIVCVMYVPSADSSTNFQGLFCRRRRHSYSHFPRAVLILPNACVTLLQLSSCLTAHANR